MRLRCSLEARRATRLHPAIESQCLCEAAQEAAARGRQGPARRSRALQSGWGVPGATSPASGEDILPLPVQSQTSLSPFSHFLQPLEDEFFGWLVLVF